MITTAFVIACLFVLCISLLAEHFDRRYTDAVVFTLSLFTSLLICLIGQSITHSLWPGKIQPFVAVAAATDAALSALYITRAVRSYAFYKLLLAFIGSSMCVVHVFFLLHKDFTPRAIYAWWFTADVNFGLSLLIIAITGGACVCREVHYRLSRFLVLHRHLGTAKTRRKH